MIFFRLITTMKETFGSLNVNSREVIIDPSFFIWLFLSSVLLLVLHIS